MTIKKQTMTSCRGRCCLEADCTIVFGQCYIYCVVLVIIWMQDHTFLNINLDKCMVLSCNNASATANMIEKEPAEF